MRRNYAAAAALAGLLSAASVTGCDRTERATVGEQQPEERQQARDDRWITTSVQAKYQTGDRIRAADVDVTTHDGVVTLQGTVPNDEVRQQALQIARSVDGVTNVQDQLQVRADVAEASDRATSTRAGRPEEGGAERANPSWITTKIQAEYFVNPEIKPWNIDVTTASGGLVTLEGEVEEQADKQEAVRIAQATEGVTRVEDRLRVRGETDADDAVATTGAGAPDANEPDAWVTAKIQAKYFTDSDVKGRDIDVDTRQGVVTLTGTVDSEAERRQAVALARNTDGVQNVQDQLQVSPEQEGTSGTAGTEARGEIRETARGADDTWIVTKIQSKYFLDSEVKGHDIDVNSRNGIVNLTGTVASEAQKNMAAEIARDTQGVTKVVNELTVSAGRQ